jgi:hypothetical protein
MLTSYFPVMHCEKMAVTGMSFHQRAVIAFLVKEGNSAGVIYERLHDVWRCLLGAQQCQKVGETF